MLIMLNGLCFSMSARRFGGIIAVSLLIWCFRASLSDSRTEMYEALSQLEDCRAASWFSKLSFSILNLSFAIKFYLGESWEV